MTSLEQETSKKIADTNTQLDAYAKQMEEQAEKTRAAIKALTTKTEGEIKAESERAAAATAEFTKADEARQADARKFLEEQMAAATMAKDRADADLALGSAFNQLNDDLAKQAALSDSRFMNTVKDIDAAKAEATAAVTQLRKDFGTRLIEVNALVKNIESRLSSNIAKVSGEVAEEKALQARVNERTVAELDRIEKLANKRNAEDVRARGALRQVMDENKAAAQEEVKALKTKLMAGIDELRSKNAANRREMASDLSKATEEFSGKLAAQKKAQDAAHASLTSSIGAATAKSASELKAAQEMFDSKITMLTNTVVANHKHAQAGIEKLTGVVADTKKANAADRELIRAETKAAEADLQKALDRAISIGEARAKATEQRIAEHLKNTKRYLQVELIEQAEKAADNVFNILQGKRQFIADNYLSLKAYAIAAADKIQDYRES